MNLHSMIRDVFRSSMKFSDADDWVDRVAGFALETVSTSVCSVAFESSSPRLYSTSPNASSAGETEPPLNL